MKSIWFSYYLTVLLLAVIAALGYWVFHISPEFQKVALASPLPTTFSITKNNQVTSLEFWIPSSEILKNTNLPHPAPTAKAILSYDLTTNKILYSRNQTEHVPMASLTKIMTAIISLEHPVKNDTYIVNKADLVGEDSMGLDAGEKLSLKELLTGLILHSGNDAAETLASNYPNGNRKAFIQAMNDKAKALGLTSTNFTNPSGLEGDGDQYTTAYDLLTMTRYAMQFPLFAQVSAMPTVDIPQTSTHKEYNFDNETNLLTSYPGVAGVKTGYTPEAGYCLVTYLNYSNHQIIAVLLGSTDRRADMKQILDYSLTNLGITPPTHE